MCRTQRCILEYPQCPIRPLQLDLVCLVGESTEETAPPISKSTCAGIYAPPSGLAVFFPRLAFFVGFSDSFVARCRMKTRTVLNMSSACSSVY